MPLFQRRTEALCHCAKGALTRSSSLYFRGEGRSCCLLIPENRGSLSLRLYFRGEGSRQSELLPLFQSRTESLSRRTDCLYFRGEGSLDTELLPLFQRRREELLPLNPSGLEENRGSLPLRLYFSGEGSLDTELLPLFQRRREECCLLMPLFQRRTEALCRCASILEEKGAVKLSYCLYFRGEGSLTSARSETSNSVRRRAAQRAQASRSRDVIFVDLREKK